MDDIIINDENIREAGKDIVTLTTEINEIIDNTFTLMQEMITKTGEWVGTSATEFVRQANIDKANYVQLKNDINEFGKYLIEYANTMDKVILEVKR